MAAEQKPKIIVPLDRTYWVVPGKLLAGPYPGDIDPAAMKHKMEVLLDAGIRLIVNLMEEDEKDLQGRPFIPYEPAWKSIAGERGIEVAAVRFPVRDMDVPGKETMTAILDAMDGSIEKGRPVYVHCLGGLGRTGTVAGCYIARHGIAIGVNALIYLQELRNRAGDARKDSPQTSQQQWMVAEWRQGE